MKKSSAGVTLLEVMIVALILGIVGMLTVIGAKFLSQLNRQGVQVDIDRQAQVLLEEITREVRVSRSLIAVSSSTLKFSVYNISKGYDSGTNTDLFNAAQIGTVTYQHFNYST